MELNEVILNAPLFGEKRKPKSESDFGDERTVGLKLKRAGKRFEDFTDYDFGYYLGWYKERYHVGTQIVLSFEPSRLESYNSLEELKENWILD